MKIVTTTQGTEEWINARLGVPSASQAQRIITPKTRRPSAQQDKYIACLIAESVVGFPCGPEATAFMERGSQMERGAVAEWEFHNQATTQECGFITTDDGRFGCSPDRFVGDDGILETKALSAENHVAALLGMKDEDYFVQCQAQLYVTGRKWVARICHNPMMPQAETRIARDEEFLADFERELGEFIVRLEEARDRIGLLMLGKVVAA